MWFKIEVDSPRKEVVYNGNSYTVGAAILPDDTGFLWELRETKLYGFHICHFIGDKFIYQVPLKKSGTYHMGDTYGYRETPMEEEPDPIRKVLLKYRLSKSKLVENDLESTTLRRSSYTLENETELPSGSKAKSFMTDGKIDKLEKDPQTGYHRYELSEYNYFIEYTLMRGRNGYVYMIEQVVVRSHAPQSIRLEVAERLDGLLAVGQKSIQTVKELIQEESHVFI